MTIHVAKKWPEMVAQQSFMSNIHFESEFMKKKSNKKEDFVGFFKE